MNLFALSVWPVPVTGFLPGVRIGPRPPASRVVGIWAAGLGLYISRTLCLFSSKKKPTSFFTPLCAVDVYGAISDFVPPMTGLRGTPIAFVLSKSVFCW